MDAIAQVSFDDAALASAMCGRAPRRYDRAGRVSLLAECAEALLAGREPSREAALFLAGGVLSWLQQGGDLTREYWGVVGPAGSHRTPAHVWRELQNDSSSRGEQALDHGGTLGDESSPTSRTDKGNHNEQQIHSRPLPPSASNQ